MTTLAPQPARDELQRLLRRRDDLADQLAAHHNHGLPTNDLWLALVRLEDHLRETHPRTYATYLPGWLRRHPRGTHPRGGHHPACPLCAACAEAQTVPLGRHR